MYTLHVYHVKPLIVEYRIYPPLISGDYCLYLNFSSFDPYRIQSPFFFYIRSSLVKPASLPGTYRDLLVVWVGLIRKCQRKPRFEPPNMGFSCEFSLTILGLVRHASPTSSLPDNVVPSQPPNFGS